MLRLIGRLAVFVDMRRYLLRARIDLDVDRMWERRPFLNMPIVEQMKETMLGEDGLLVIDRAIAKVEDQSRPQIRAAHALRQVAVGKQFARGIAQFKEAMERALAMAYRYGFGPRVRRAENCCQQGECPAE